MASPGFGSETGKQLTSTARYVVFTALGKWTLIVYYPSSTLYCLSLAVRPAFVAFWTTKGDKARSLSQTLDDLSMRNSANATWANWRSCTILATEQSCELQRMSMHEYRDDSQYAIYDDVVSTLGVIRVNGQGVHYNQPHDRCYARYPSMNTMLVDSMQILRSVRHLQPSCSWFFAIELECSRECVYQHTLLSMCLFMATFCSVFCSSSRQKHKISAIRTLNIPTMEGRTYDWVFQREERNIITE